MFYYRAIYLRNQTEEPIGLIVTQATTGSLRAVIWDRRLEKWVFRPDVAAPLLFGEKQRDRWQLISRDEASRIAADLGTSLPSEEELNGLCDQGQRQG